MRYLLILLTSLLFTPAWLSAQNKFTITGMVKDEQGLPLPGATVFLTGTKLITSSDNSGAYKLENIPAGSYVLVIKMIGYTAFSIQITLSSKPLQVLASLQPNATLLNEVKIHPDYDREKHLALFKKEFLGQTPNAKLCKILNLDVLYFTYDKKTKVLTAVADEFLIIENSALGYKVKYLLDNFSFNENTHVSTYQGFPSFDELSSNKTQETLWAKNRKIAYSGSVNHFVKSVFEGRSVQEGFNVYKIVNRPITGFEKNSNKIARLENELVKFDSLLTNLEDGSKKLTFKDALFVVYRNEKEPDEFKEFTYSFKEASAQIPEGQSSMVYLLADDGVDIDDNGLYTPANGLFFEGYWAWEKVAELMPVEYHL